MKRFARPVRRFFYLSCCACLLLCGCAETGRVGGGQQTNTVDGGGVGDSGASVDAAPIVGDPENKGCISDRVAAETTAKCTRSCADCDCTKKITKCDLSCYSPAAANDPECLLAVDSQGNVIGGAKQGDCQSEACGPPSDVTPDMACQGTGCKLQPNELQLQIQPNPNQQQEEIERQDAKPSVLFVVDNSKSMADDQINARCAVDSFFSSAGAGGAFYQTGVISTDVFYDDGYYKYPSKLTLTDPMYNSSGFIKAPTLLKLRGGQCDLAQRPACQCGQTVQDPDAKSVACTAESGGSWIDGGSPQSQQQIKDLIVRGDDASMKECGLEVAFQLFAEMERNGTFAQGGPYEVVAISDEDAECDFMCKDSRTFGSIDRNTAGIPNFNPPTPLNTKDSCRQDLIDFYKYYFTSRQIIVHGLIFQQGCPDFDGMGTNDPPITYEAVIAATQGHKESICACEKFPAFFSAVGNTTATLSKGLCLKASQIEPGSLKVSYQGQNLSPSDWSFDPQTRCIALSEKYKDAYGKFTVSYQDPTAAASSAKVCFPPNVDPLVKTLQLSCAGQVITEDPQNGQTFDPATDCFTLHGDAAKLAGSCSVSFF